MMNKKDALLDLERRLLEAWKSEGEYRREIADDEIIRALCGEAAMAINEYGKLFPPKKSMSIVYVPWTPAQVVALNRYQHTEPYHPFTCGNDRGDAQHVRYAETHGHTDYGILVATENGWKCPVCNYTQYWAHDFMMGGA